MAVSFVNYRQYLESEASKRGLKLVYSYPVFVSGDLWCPSSPDTPQDKPCYHVYLDIGHRRFQGYGPTAFIAKAAADYEAYKEISKVNRLSTEGPHDPFQSSPHYRDPTPPKLQRQFDTSAIRPMYSNSNVNNNNNDDDGNNGYKVFPAPMLQQEPLYYLVPIGALEGPPGAHAITCAPLSFFGNTSSSPQSLPVRLPLKSYHPNSDKPTTNKGRRKQKWSSSQSTSLPQKWPSLSALKQPTTLPSVKQRSPSPVEQRSPCPVRQRSPSPFKQRSPCPVRGRSPSPVKHRAQSSFIKQRSSSYSPVRKIKPVSIVKRRSLSSSSMKQKSTFCFPFIKEMSISQTPLFSSPVKQRSPLCSMVKQRSPSLSPVKQRSPLLSLVKQRSPSLSPVKQRSPSLSPVKQKSPSLSPVKQRSPSLSSVKQRSLSLFPVKQRSLSHSPVNQRSSSLSPVKQRSPSPSPVKQRSPSFSPVRQKLLIKQSSPSFSPEQCNVTKEGNLSSVVSTRPSYHVPKTSEEAMNNLISCAFNPPQIEQQHNVSNVSQEEDTHETFTFTTEQSLKNTLLEVALQKGYIISFEVCQVSYGVQVKAIAGPFTCTASHHKKHIAKRLAGIKLLRILKRQPDHIPPNICQPIPAPPSVTEFDPIDQLYNLARDCELDTPNYVVNAHSYNSINYCICTVTMEQESGIGIGTSVELSKATAAANLLLSLKYLIQSSSNESGYEGTPAPSLPTNYIPSEVIFNMLSSQSSSISPESSSANSHSLPNRRDSSDYNLTGQVSSEYSRVFHSDSNMLPSTNAGLYASEYPIVYSSTTTLATGPFTDTQSSTPSSYVDYTRFGGMKGVSYPERQVSPCNEMRGRGRNSMAAGRRSNSMAAGRGRGRHSILGRGRGMGLSGQRFSSTSRDPI